ncbi:hypothetical protein CRM22_008505 [Opisthorchis felineus]|uniref:Uncharacterized protein n=1 Tax=Opisthorchis felineus TaxID=147828 RepID=A0A4V3SDF6_OPIFE|nr:hypothetical protein CRM22_008505 [Opisthorchis felineus]
MPYLFFLFSRSIEGEKLGFFVYQRLVSPQPSEDNNHFCSHLKSLNPGVWSDGTFTDCSVGAVTGEILRYTVSLDEDKLKSEYQDLDVELLSWYVSKLLSGTENGCETTAEFTDRDFTSDARGDGQRTERLLCKRLQRGEGSRTKSGWHNPCNIHCHHYQLRIERKSV